MRVEGDAPWAPGTERPQCGRNEDVRRCNNAMRIISPCRRKRVAGRLVLLATGLLLPSLDSAGAEPLTTDLQAMVERQARNHHVCAISYATVRAGRPSRSGGASGCDGMRVPTEDTVFQAASLSKPVFAYAVLKLAQEGWLSLDTPLISYLPQGYLHIQNPFAFGRPPVSDRVEAPELQAVTARMVLNHTSGLPNWSSEPLAFDFAPGTGWQYSGEGFMLLQRVVEALTNEKLDDFMRHRLFDPLGMSNTAFRWTPQFADMITPDASSSGQPGPLAFPEAMAPVSLYTTASDYAKFLAALIADRQAVQLIVEADVTVIPKLGLSWGLGWGVERGEREAFVWQWGNNPGYRAFVMASTSSGDAVVMLTSSENGLAMAAPIVTAVLPEIHRAFQSYLVREGLSYFACKHLDWCM